MKTKVGKKKRGRRSAPNKPSLLDAERHDSVVIIVVVVENGLHVDDDHPIRRKPQSLGSDCRADPTIEHVDYLNQTCVLYGDYCGLPILGECYALGGATMQKALNIANRPMVRAFCMSPPKRQHSHASRRSNLPKNPLSRVCRDHPGHHHGPYQRQSERLKAPCLD